MNAMWRNAICRGTNQIVTVRTMNYIAVRGKGDPNEIGTSTQ